MGTRIFEARLMISPIALCLLSLLSFAQAPARDSTDARLSKEFQQRAKRYLNLRKKAAGTSPSPTTSAETIVAKQRDLANKIRVTRAGALQGEIFTPEVAQYFRRQISKTIHGPYGEQVRASLRHAEPVKMDLQVNQSYPEQVPLQSMPPNLLLNLPGLPDGLEYRLLDRELVLRDREANIIVDYVPNAFPEQ